jgi:hypothetical protein
MDVKAQKAEANRSVDVHIEELVLRGFALGDRYRIAEAMEQELSRLIADHGVPGSLANGDDLHQVDGGSFQAGPLLTPEATGRQVAQALFDGLGFSDTAVNPHSSRQKNLR